MNQENHEFALDLRVARRGSGLTQEDCAHLLAVHPSRISLIENGKRLPSVREICTLSLIYGRSFESLFWGIHDDAHYQLIERMKTLPKASNKWKGNENRANTLSALAKLLEAHTIEHGGAA